MRKIIIIATLLLAACGNETTTPAPPQQWLGVTLAPSDQSQIAQACGLLILDAQASSTAWAAKFSGSSTAMTCYGSASTYGMFYRFREGQ